MLIPSTVSTKFISCLCWDEFVIFNLCYFNCFTILFLDDLISTSCQGNSARDYHKIITDMVSSSLGNKAGISTQNSFSTDSFINGFIKKLLSVFNIFSKQNCPSYITLWLSGILRYSNMYDTLNNFLPS